MLKMPAFCSFRTSAEGLGSVVTLGRERKNCRINVESGRMHMLKPISVPLRPLRLCGLATCPKLHSYRSPSTGPV